MFTEFYEQGDEERKLGLPISLMCDRTKPNVERSQVRASAACVHACIASAAVPACVRACACTRLCVCACVMAWVRMIWSGVVD